jgi:hypothetical protein
MVVLHYIFDYDSTNSTSEIDHCIQTFLWHRTKFRPPAFWSSVLRRLIISFSDNQLVTGLAILAGGFSQLNCGISALHWKVLIFLAWFSSLTHLATLFVLRQYFRERPAISLVRVILMLATLGLTIVAIVPIGSPEWPANTLDWQTLAKFKRPALCYIKTAFERKGEQIFSWASTPFLVMFLGMIVPSYAARLLDLFPKAHDGAKLWLEKKPGEFIVRVLDRLAKKSRWGVLNWCKGIVFVVVYMGYVSVSAVLELYHASVWKVSCGS